MIDLHSYILCDIRDGVGPSHHAGYVSFSPGEALRQWPLLHLWS